MVTVSSSKPFVELSILTTKTLGYGVMQLEKLILETVNDIDEAHCRVRFNSAKRHSFAVTITLLISKKSQHHRIMSNVARELKKIGLLDDDQIKIEE